MIHTQRLTFQLDIIYLPDHHESWKMFGRIKPIVSRKSLCLFLSLVVVLGLVTQAVWVTTEQSQPVAPLPGVTTMPAFTPGGASVSSALPQITNISTNISIYPNGQVPRYSKFEITFQVATQASNLQLPYDTAPPAGLQAGQGISVDALLTPDNWKTTYKQPAFYYQDFLHQFKSGREWIYPTASYSWKVRFSPDREGNWQFKLAARDSGGYSETVPQSFAVMPSASKGFVRVSPSDSRYFEFSDGTYFPGLGYNMNYDHIGWNNPVLDNQDNFQKMSQNGIQLVRMWLSEWSIFGSAWSPWNSINPSLHAQYIPYQGINLEVAYPGSDVSMEIQSQYNPCMFIGFLKSSPAIKRETTYRIRIQYKTAGISGPRTAGKPFGLVAKTGGWLSGSNGECENSGSGTVVTPYQSQSISDWKILEGSLNSEENDFLPYFYLVMENVIAGSAYIDYVWIEEDLGNGNYGPNLVTKPWMSQDLYMAQRESYAFDQVVELAGYYGIYLRPVIMEKNEVIFNQINYQGNPVLDDPRCWDSNPDNDPAECPGNQWFYGNWNQVTKVRWLQQAWWRYLQARWGYSPSIHSWELLNEGDPYSGPHYTLAEEFGKYMHQFAPNDHLVSTSFWHSFPKTEFWANPSYSHVDFADFHQYIGEDDPLINDTSLATTELSLTYGARQPGGANKQVIRGETGFINPDTWQPTSQFERDPQGLWLHNFIWGGINPGGLIEQYWFENVHIYKQNSDKTYKFDFRPQFSTYFNFMKGIPLSNGNYQDAAAQSTNAKLRVIG